MKFELIETLFRNIPLERLQEVQAKKLNLICWGSGYPQDFPYLVVDSNNEFRAKFKELKDAVTYVNSCL